MSAHSQDNFAKLFAPLVSCIRFLSLFKWIHRVYHGLDLSIKDVFHHLLEITETAHGGTDEGLFIPM